MLLCMESNPDSSKAHRNSHQNPTEERICDGLVDGQTRIFEHSGKGTDRDHEDGEPGSFRQIFGPMTSYRIKHAVGTTSLRIARKLVADGESLRGEELMGD